ncbi:ABC transporter ATP-binding protein [soil metagenome]
MSVLVFDPVNGRVDEATAAPTGCRVSVDGVSKVFETPSGPTLAVDDVSIYVHSGEFIVIVGPSGCGKTTLLRMIANLERPSSGSISIDSGATDASTAMVFQGRSVFPWLTVEDNVAYGLKTAGLSRPERRSRTGNLLSLVGLSQFASSYPHQISEGMRQRVALARALAVEPRLLLMDEPFGALDEQTRFILQDEVLRIWENTGKTIILVTHSIDEALTLADRVVVMSAHPGRVKATIPIPFARPRLQSDVRADPRFADLFSEIWDLLRDEVRSARIAAGEIVR